MKKHLFTALAITLSPLLAEETDIGFRGALPEDSKWQNTGSLQVKSVDEAGVKCLSFDDESDTETLAIAYAIDAETAERMKTEGYTLNIRFKHILENGSQGNFSFVLRLPELSPLQISPYANASKQLLGVGVFDFREQINRNASLKVADDFIDLKAIYRPDASTGGGNCEIVLGDQESTNVSISPMDKSPRAAIEIGGRIAERMGCTFVESLKLSIP